jgi:tetratricopeptide (TPR) repeat protein
MELDLFEIVSIMSKIIPLIPIVFLFHRREIHKSYYSTTWTLSKYLKPRDLLGERPFQEYYEERDIDRQLNLALREHQNILIKGPSLAGKSRAIFEVLRKNKEAFDILIPICREINPDSFILPYRARFWRKGVVILDDLQRFVEQPGFELLIHKILNCQYIVIASSRTGKDFQLVENKFAEQGLDIRSIFKDNKFEIPQIEEKIAKRIASKTKIDWRRVSFNGTVGSIFMELLEMKTRFVKASDNEKSFLRSLKKLYDCGVYQGKGTFPITWVRRIYPCDETLQNSLLEALQLKEFFKVNKGIIEVEPVYLEEVISSFPTMDIHDLCHELGNFFQDKPQVLLKIGDRLRDIGWNSIEVVSYLKAAIIQYRKALESDRISRKSYGYAIIQDHLGTAYAMLADFEEKSENCRRAIEAHREALNIFTFEQFPMAYAQTQHNLGLVYGILTDVEPNEENFNLAFSACNEALKIYTKDKFPMAYAMTQNNLGISYGNLAKVRDKQKNIQKAIFAFTESLNYLVSDRFPDEYAMTQLNLGNEYSHLSEVENSKDNCQKAIGAFKNSLIIFTIDHHPRDYAMAQNGLGNAYRNLGKIENRIENCRRAIIAFKNALNVFTIEFFPIQYADVQSNIALAYWTLAGEEGNEENIREAIEAWKNSLKIHTFGKFPREFARTQNNLGAAYLAIAKIKDKSDNCRLAIIAFNESLTIQPFEEDPTGYAMSQFNLGTAYAMLAELENISENCRLAAEAYRKVIRIRTTMDKFPIPDKQLQLNIEILKSVCGTRTMGIF